MTISLNLIADSLRPLRDEAVQNDELVTALYFAQKVCTLNASVNIQWAKKDQQEKINFDVDMWKDRLVLVKILMRRTEFARALFILNVYRLDISTEKGLHSQIQPSIQLQKAQCLYSMDKVHDSLECLTELLAKLSQSRTVSNQTAHDAMESKVRLWLGKCHLKLGNQLTACQELIQAYKLDCGSYEAFSLLLAHDHNRQTLVNHQSSGCEQFQQKFGQAALFIQESFLAHLHPFQQVNAGLERPGMDEQLKDDIDFQLSKCQLLKSRRRFSEALQLTSVLLQIDRYHPRAVKLHSQLLQQCSESVSLYRLSSNMVEQYPNTALTFYTVALYYYCQYQVILSGSDLSQHQNETGITAESSRQLKAKKQLQMARRYFSQCVQLDSSFLDGWLGFGQTFSDENEHESALTAFSTACRLSTSFVASDSDNGTSVNKSSCHNYEAWICMAIEYSKCGNYQLASELFQNAMDSVSNCQDALLLNEFASHLCRNMQKHKQAYGLYERAVKFMASANHLQYDCRFIATFLSNFAYCCLQLNMYTHAEQYLRQSLHAHRTSTAQSMLGYVLQLQGHYDDAVDCYHSAMLMDPYCAVTVQQLEIAMQEAVQSKQQQFWDKHEMKQQENATLQNKKPIES